jgi:hypothetical protein
MQSTNVVKHAAAAAAPPSALEPDAESADCDSPVDDETCPVQANSANAPANDASKWTDRIRRLSSRCIVSS